MILTSCWGMIVMLKLMTVLNFSRVLAKENVDKDQGQESTSIGGSLPLQSKAHKKVGKAAFRSH
ncbi:MAG: hypothetical protein LBT62_03725 [Deltaproteobacteria bacterium]|nr:hypothetical protein [Deltaproteobacteria bacterium]